MADTDITTFIKRSDLSRDRSEQRPERFNVGDKVDAAVISLDKHSRRITVSIKALEIAEEKQAVAQYGSSDSGASLGDIFKAAIKKKEGADEKTEDGRGQRAADPKSSDRTSNRWRQAAGLRASAADGRGCPRWRAGRRRRQACHPFEQEALSARHSRHGIRDRNRP